jgi:hypothetical protein
MCGPCIVQLATGVKLDFIVVDSWLVIAEKHCNDLVHFYYSLIRVNATKFPVAIPIISHSIHIAKVT